MAKIPIVYYPDTILTTRSADVTEIDQEVVDFIEAMRETMYTSNGIGLAAPQVGKNVRIMTVDVEPDEAGKKFQHFINPVIVDGFGRTTWEEGCLSFPGLVIEVKRRKQVHLQAYDLDGKLIDIEADGLLAICIQHELDHLNGVVMVDRLNPVQKTIVVRDYLRKREDQKDDDRIDQIVALHQGHVGLVDRNGRPVASGAGSTNATSEGDEAVVVASLGRPVDGP